MTKAEKQTFIHELVANVARDVVSKIPLMPEGWDGIELRWYVAQKFAESTMQVLGDGSRRRRKREYENEVIVRNL